jgi:hypothetical protein
MRLLSLLLDWGRCLIAGGAGYSVLKPTFDRTEYAILVQGVTPALPCFVG